MVRNEKEKAAALILTVACIILYLVQVSTGQPALSEVGISRDCTILARLTYSFFHASMLHCIVNCWCLLSVVFAYRLSLWSLLLAYATAVLYPIDTVSYAFTQTTTVGLSAVCFSLLGQIAFQVQRKLYFHLCILTFISFGYIIPWGCSLCGISVVAPNNLLHIYSYVVGLLVGFLNSPAPWQQK